MTGSFTVVQTSSRHSRADTGRMPAPQEQRFKTRTLRPTVGHSEARSEIYFAAMSKSYRRVIGTAAVALAMAVGAWQIRAGFAAQQSSEFDPHLFGALAWRLIGPFRGGRAIAATGVPSQPDVYYFGGVAGGVWKSSDDGLVWRPTFDSQPTSSIGAIAVAPSDPNVIYAGTGEADIRSDISYGDGVYKSTDAGGTWQHIGLEATRAIGRILVDPHDPNIVLVAALGHPYGLNPERGVFRSTDGGQTWNKVLYKDDNTGAVDLAADSETGQMVYASLWQARRPPWSVYGPIEGPGGALYRSADGGATWTELHDGLPTGSVHRIGVAVAPGSHGQRVYALIDTDQAQTRGLYRSDDAGATWKHVSSDPRIDGRAWYFSGITIDPQNPERVYVANTALYRSDDGGANFAPIKGAPGGDDYHFLWINPEDSKRMIVASDQGTVVSVDGGETWSSWYNQPTAQLYHVITDNQFPYHVYGAQQDSGSIEVASRTDAMSISFRDTWATAGGEGGYMAPDPLHPDIVIGGDTYGGIDRLWKSTHQVQNISPAIGSVPSFGSGGGCHAGAGFRFTWTSPILFSLKDPRALYFSSQVLWRSLDDGTSWQTISPDLTRPATGPQPPPGGGPADFAKVTGCGVIYTVAPSPLKADEVWAGTDDGQIQLTQDGGKTWKNVTPPALGPWSTVSLMDASHFDAGAAYAAIDRHTLDDYAPHILRTHDYGATWQEVDTGLPQVGYVHVVREDPLRQGLLFAGTETGVDVSFDDGVQWQSLQLNLPATPVHDLVVKGDDLVIATHGRSFWILDDIEPLRELNSQIAASDAHLFKPQPAVRLRPRAFEGTPLPVEEATGGNPPVGAVIDYVLKAASSSNVQIEIFDAEGRSVRRYSSTDPRPRPQRMPVVTSNWVEAPPGVTANAGLNRFVWDLRYAPPESNGGGGFFRPRGPMALPGEYRVRLTLNGHSYEQPLRVELDPRVKMPLKDVVHQFTFEQDVIGAMTSARDLNTAVHDLGAKLAGLEKPMAAKPDTAAVAHAMQALEAKLALVTGEASAGAQSGPAGSAPASLGRVSSVLTQALLAADGVDAAPTESCEAAAHTAEAMLASAREQWARIQKEDLNALNGLLAQHGLGRIQAIDEP
jgi:photosystem II stability/assembly factor-like uncharacterized protein